MSDTTPAVHDSTVSAMTSSSAGSSAHPPLSQAIYSVNIKSLIPYTLSMESSNYRKWRNLFLLVLGRFNLCSHVEDGNPHHDDPEWVKENLQVLMWLYATISEDLIDMVMDDNPTAHGVWDKLRAFFNANKPSRAVHLEAEFHSISQGDLSVSTYCHKLKTLADALADCDQPVGDRALVHQLIRGLNPKFHVLKSLLPVLPTFPTFLQARNYLLVEEQSKASEDSSSSNTALVAHGQPPSSDTSTPRPNNDDHAPNNFYPNNGYRGRGGRGRGRGRGGRNDRGRSRHQQQQMAPWWAAPWAGGWRAPWTGATGPGVLGRPPAPAGQAYPVMQQPSTTQAPLQSSSWDTNGLIHALNTMSLQQQANAGDWYMDTGASSHMTGDSGSSQQGRNHEVQ